VDAVRERKAVSADEWEDELIRTSENITELCAALTAAQSKFGAAIKSSQNPAFRSKYADLTSIIDATLEHLNAEGIACMQHPDLTYAGEGENREAMITVTTRLQHKSGQFMESDLSIPAVQRDRFDAQSCGSAITYACRYALQSICLVPREDDDGNAATGTGTKDAAQAVAKKKIEKAASEGSKTAQSVLKQADPLLYVFPKSHNGNYAEFYVRPYLQSHPEDEDGLRLVFSSHKAKKTKDETALVPSDQMESLLNALAGDYGVTLYQLEAK